MPLAAIEFDSDGRACRIVRAYLPEGQGVLDVLATGHRMSESDVDWCERDQTLYVHEVGGWTGRVYLGQLVQGVRRKLWAHESTTFCRADGENEMISAADVAALGYDLVYGPQPDWAPDGWSGGRVHYCQRCDDMIPDRDHCFDHEYWCDDCGDFFQKKHDQCEHYCHVCEIEKTDGCEDHDDD